MKTSKFLILISISISFASCSSWKHTHRVSEIGDKNIAVTNEVAVDIKVDLNKVVRANSQKHKTVQAAKDEARFAAIRDNNIHIVVDPIYSIQSTKTLFGTTHSASLTGFAGYYVNARSQKEVDDAKYAKEQAEDQAAFESAVKNYKRMLEFNTTVATSEKEITSAKDCKTCPSAKSKTKTTTTEEFFKLLELVK